MAAKRMKSASKYDDDVVNEIPVENAPTMCVNDELDDYINDATIGRVSASELGTFWNKNRERWPRLAFAAKRILCVSASNANAERVFSLARSVITWQSASLHSDTVDHTITLHKVTRSDTE